MVKDDDRLLAMLPHLLSIFTGFLGPLVMYFVVKDKDVLVKDNVRNALNFQLSLIIYYLIGFILVFVLIGLVLIPILSIFALIVEIIGIVKAYGGDVYKYPLTIPFLRD